MSHLVAGWATSAPPTPTGAFAPPEPRGDPPPPDGGPSFRETLRAAQEPEGWPAESEASTEPLTEAELGALAALLPAPMLPGLATLAPALTPDVLSAGFVEAQSAPPLQALTALFTSGSAAEALAVEVPLPTSEEALTDFAALEAGSAPTSALAALEAATDSPESFASEATTDAASVKRALAADLSSLMQLAGLAQAAPEATSVSSELARLAEAHAPDFLPQVQRGLEALTHAGQATLRLQLEPEHLGRLDLQLTTSAEGVRVSIVTDQPMASRLLETHLADLRQTLTDAGLTIAGLSVSLNMDNGQAFNMAKWHAPAWLNNAAMPMVSQAAPAEEPRVIHGVLRLGLGHQVDCHI